MPFALSWWSGRWATMRRLASHTGKLLAHSLALSLSLNGSRNGAWHGLGAWRERGRGRPPQSRDTVIVRKT